MTKVAVIGCGNWGKNLTRNFFNLEALYGVCDLKSDTLDLIKRRYPSIEVTDDITQILKSSAVDALVIATPNNSHYKIAKLALEQGKHVFVEKPMATTSQQAKELCLIAEENSLVLMVGHLLLYHPAINRLKQLIAEDYLGKVLYLESYRLNINTEMDDTSVLWDLAPHDISMISYLLDEDPLSVISAVGYSTFCDGIMDVAHLDLAFGNNINVHLHDSWITPEKQVKLMVIGSDRTAFINDLEHERKLYIYNSRRRSETPQEYPFYLPIEPLKLECQHFLNCIQNRQRARSDGEDGYKVVKILEEAETMIMMRNQTLLAKK